MGKAKRKNKKNIRKTRAIHEDTQDEGYKTAPHSFVFHRGKVGVNVRTLASNLRRLMEPYTATRLQVIGTFPVPIIRGVKKLTKTRLPDLGKFDDISEYIERGGNQSESEAENDGPHNEVTLPQKMHGRGNLKAGQSAIRLKEIGPRMTLELVKIEEGLCQGAVIHHAFIQKTPADLEADKKRKTEKLKLKKQRRAKQSENLKKKERAMEEHKERTLAGMKRKELEEKDVAAESESDDDIAHYKREVGVNPEAELFPRQGLKRKKPGKSDIPNKKFKINDKLTAPKTKAKKVAPPGFRKKEQVAKQKKKKLLQKKSGKTVKHRNKSGPGGFKPRKKA